MPCGDLPGPCAFEQVHRYWIAGNFAALLAQFDDDIVWNINVDGSQAPFASSTVGKKDLRKRLQHLVDVFSIKGFEVQALEHGPDICRSVVRLNYVHRKTGEALNVMVRFSGRKRNGLLVHFDERVDASYVEAFARFVRYLEDTNRGDASEH